MLRKLVTERFWVKSFHFRGLLDLETVLIRASHKVDAPVLLGYPSIASKYICYN